MTGTGTYMYAITRPLPESAFAEVPGMLGSPVRVVSDRGLACVVSTVDLADFGEQELLSVLDGRDEWGLKLLGRVAQPMAAVAASSGAEYLRRQRDDFANRDELSVAASRRADDVYTFVATSAVAARRHRPQDARLSGLARPMLLNASFLVDRDEADAFRRSIDAVAQALPPDSVQLTGPWPAYSFTALEDG